MGLASEFNSVDECPVSEATFASIMRSTPQVAAELVRGLPINVRARLAVFCYRRTHLRKLGLLVASTCTKYSLVAESGNAGELIHFQAQNLDIFAADEPLMSAERSRRQVSLPSF